jgi:hypothetical protein
MLSGPRLDAEVAVGSYPSPAAEGRDWKYFGMASPLSSVNACPIRDEPTSRPSAVTIEPSARDLSPGSCAIPVTTSG